MKYLLILMGLCSFNSQADVSFSELDKIKNGDEFIDIFKGLSKNNKENILKELTIKIRKQIKNRPKNNEISADDFYAANNTINYYFTIKNVEKIIITSGIRGKINKLNRQTICQTRMRYFFDAGLKFNYKIKGTKDEIYKRVSIKCSRGLDEFKTK